MTLQYDGSDFAGWQAQPGLRTVQGTLEGALQNILGVPVRIHGAGRTDAGVHAAGQVAHVDVEGGPPPTRLPLALNRALPPDVRVLGASPAPDGFHARTSSVFKEYHYTVL